ncbi:hypothetical protein C1H46_022151 [Malus baccata]|uniref:Uncharacterized protein n=1 Tax=Malus baccata TaxID=106549 RepID=A0A540M147_MALBA|nr:hypothetical protein C1H46_022151 [Malus baccata]
MDTRSTDPLSSLTSLPLTGLPNSSRGQVLYDFGQTKKGKKARKIGIRAENVWLAIGNYGKGRDWKTQSEFSRRIEKSQAGVGMGIVLADSVFGLRERKGKVGWASERLCEKADMDGDAPKRPVGKKMEKNGSLRNWEESLG